MKNTWKRTLAILLSALLLFTTLPMAFAAVVGSGSVDSITWSLDSDGVMTIAGSGAMPGSVGTKGTIYPERLPTALANAAKTALAGKGFRIIDAVPTVTRPYN